jgi:hypothetical protein
MNEVKGTDKLMKAEPSVEEPKFEITLSLSEKYWNEALEKYLYSTHTDEPVLVSNTPEVTFETSSLWNITDKMYSGSIKQVIIRRVN